MKYIGKFVSNIVFIIIVIIIIVCIINNNVKKKNNELIGNEYINSSEYTQYISDILTHVNDENIFTLNCYLTRNFYIKVSVYSKNKLDYNTYKEQAKTLINNVYEQIKDTSIKKEGIFSIDNYIISFDFYEKFYNILDKKQIYKSVGLFQIDIKDMEKYRSYNECVSGNISDLEWKQEK